jgi:hypothetical protein
MNYLKLGIKSVLLSIIGAYFCAASDIPVSFEVKDICNNKSNYVILNMLQNSEVAKIQDIRSFLLKKGKKLDFEGNVLLVTFTNGVKAVFKNFDDRDDALSEVAAYKASTKLGFPCIPPTVIRTIKGKTGSLQLFIDTNIDLLNTHEYDKIIQSVDTKTRSNLKIFYFVLGQWDSGPHNLLAHKDKNGNLFLLAIDNSGIKSRQKVIYGNLPFVRILYNDQLNTDDWHLDFPFNKAKTIYKLKEAFGNKIAEEFYRNFKLYNLPLRYVIYQNSLWRQYHYGNEKFDMSFTNQCTTDTLTALKSLNQKVISDIFIDAKNSDFFTNKYIEEILERRNQILDYCKRQ